MPVGNSDAGMTESKTAVILPVERKMTTVAAVKRPEMTARDEATTAIAGVFAVAMIASLAGSLLLSDTVTGVGGGGNVYIRRADEGV